MRCDWYAATIPDTPQNVIGFLQNNIGGQLKRLKTGMNGYSNRWALDDENGNPNAIILAGGNNGANTHAFSGSEKAVYFRELVREVWPEHSVTRVDVAEDMYSDGLFEEFTGRLLEHSKRNRVKVSTVGDWLTDRSLDGRTLYLGSKTSSAQIRLYEKGKQMANLLFTRNNWEIPDDFPINWVRLELQLRPQKQQKEQAAKEELANFWGYAGWTREVADDLLSVDVPRVEVNNWKQSDDEKAMLWMARQYGNLLTRRLEALGDWCSVGREIGQYIEKLKK